MKIKIGSKAPSFQLKDGKGNKVKLSDFKGKKVILYFYPKDMTPGCTQESCDFQSLNSKIKAQGAVVLGVSPDSEESHVKFAGKYKLKFPLLSDPEKKAAKAYGAWGEKSLYGRKFMGIIRSTFLIGKTGKVEQVWTKVKVKGHAAEVLKGL